MASGRGRGTGTGTGPAGASAYRFEWRPEIDSAALEALHGEAFGHEPEPYDWAAQLRAHSLGWVGAFDDGDDGDDSDDGGGGGGALVGFVNVAWDGYVHAFVLDTAVAVRARHRGVGRELVRMAVEGARAAACEWLHVDFDDDLRPFYFDACGFEPTNAGLVALRPAR